MDMQEHLECVGPGWASLVRPLLERVQELGGEVLQVKEKFGGLRFYYRLPETVREAERDNLFDLVGDIEEQSFQICQDCGQPGTQTTDRRWRLTLCQACASTRGRY